MMVETRRGLTRWDCLTLADEVASCAEHDPHGPIEFKPIEALLKTRAVIWHVHVDGQVIRTTQEHPFYVWDKGWVAAKDLLKGDLLRRKDGSVAVVEDVFDTGVEETVYNCSVAEYHTYFVGGEDWGFSVWAHNTCRELARAQRQVSELNRAGIPGASQLQYLLLSASNPRGYIFQIRRAYTYFRKGVLTGVESIPSRGIYNSRIDIRVRGLRIETKSWRGFDHWGFERQAIALWRLDHQVDRFLRARGARLLIEFDRAIPKYVREELLRLRQFYGNRLTWRTIH
jgi:hypothetical protein